MFKQMQSAGQESTSDYEEAIFQNLRTGINFEAKLEPLPDLEFHGEVTFDSRASHLLMIRKSLQVSIQVTDLISGDGQRFEVLPKVEPDNAAMVHFKYLLQQLTAQDT